MRRITIGAVLLAVLAGPVYAQHKQNKDQDNPLMREYEQRQKENADIEKQYKRTLHATDQDVKRAANDPWANMRGTAGSEPKH
jgi:uncharacterized protein YxeA